MIVNRRREPQLKKAWFETFIDDTTFVEKLVYIMWCGLPYFLFLMLDIISNIWIRTISTIGIFILLSLLIYGFGKFMSSGNRDWNR